MEPESGTNENYSNTDNNTNKRKTINKSSHQTDNKSTTSLISNIDLSNVEANEESLKPYTLTKQFLKLDLDKIRELIEILEDYCISLVEKEDVKREVYSEPKLFNFDNPQYEYDSTVGKKPILNENSEINEGTSQLSFENTSISRYFTNDDENTKDQYSIENNEDEAPSKYEDETYDEEKEELEKKLMNFYASIKGAMQ